MKKEQIIKGIKIAIACVIAIAIAAELGLQYASTAGIITILSIQNTKRETIRSARNRALAFLCALILAAVFFYFLGFTLFAFAGYLLLFALLCLYAGWGEAIAMNSVLITHFLTEQSMSTAQILNETGLFLIGTLMGIIVNMHLRRKEDLLQNLTEQIDIQIKTILSRMAEWLVKDDKSAYNSDCLIQLQKSLKRARTCAFINYNNALFNNDTYLMDYIRMREQQSVVLNELYENIKSITYLPKQANQVAALLEAIKLGYHKDNTVEGLLQDLDLIIKDMKQQELPQSREEFEARAILFYILKQIHKLLMIKREFINNVQK